MGGTYIKSYICHYGYQKNVILQGQRTLLLYMAQCIDVWQRELHRDKLEVLSY